MEWQPIETAPKDGRPVWAKGNNWGKTDAGEHFCWVYWDGDSWQSQSCSDHGSSTMLYLVAWMKSA